MIKKLTKKVRTLTGSHVLALLFVLYIFYVGMDSASFIWNHTLSLIKGELSVVEYIAQADEHYTHMLSDNKKVPLLRNQGTYINMSGQMSKLLRQPVCNERANLSNGHLTTIYDEHIDPKIIANCAKYLDTLCTAQEEKGSHFLFVLAAQQVCKYENMLPVGYTDPTHPDSDMLIQLLSERQIPYLDLREELHKDGLSHDTAFYRTDHHWTTETGFWAYVQILESLENAGVIRPIDRFYTNEENYTFESRPNCFLGSAGKRTGIYYAGMDDFSMIIPDFDTDITCRIPEKDIDLRGRYEDACNGMFEPHYYSGNYFDTNHYGLYGWGDRGYTYRKNHNAPDSSKVLLIGDSFGNIPFSIMSLYFESTDELDMRYYDARNFTEYYEEYDPDIVIILVSSEHPVTKNAGPFFVDPNAEDY